MAPWSGFSSQLRQVWSPISKVEAPRLPFGKISSDGEDLCRSRRQKLRTPVTGLGKEHKGDSQRLLGRRRRDTMREKVQRVASSAPAVSAPRSQSNWKAPPRVGFKVRAKDDDGNTWFSWEQQFPRPLIGPVDRSSLDVLRRIEQPR